MNAPANTLTWQIPPVSADPVVEAENVRLHEISDAGYEANYEGVLLEANPHPAGTIEHAAWAHGHTSAQEHRDEWERAEWLNGADLA